MLVSAFDYHLPEELIAQYPTGDRTASRLLVLDADPKTPDGGLQEIRFSGIGRFLSPGDLLVFNDTRVIPARLFGNKSTGGRVEILIERVIGPRQFLARVRASKPPRPGMDIRVTHSKAIQSGVSWTPDQNEEEMGTRTLKVLERRGEFFVLETTDGYEAGRLLEDFGEVPLPPYIRRSAQIPDKARYQTVYAKRKGAVAAPTAGLHFDDALLAGLRSQGIAFAFITLHVGAGTFSPVRVDTVETHRMHSEYLEVPEEVCSRVLETRRAGGRIVAVGTTSVRALETAWRDGGIRPFRGETDIFIYPGYRFRCVDAMVTNFHLPGSTLLMLVSAFAGRERILEAYQYAIKKRFRFYSYGDAMMLFPQG